MNSPAEIDKPTDKGTEEEIRTILPGLVAQAPSEVAETLESYSDDFIAQTLSSLNPGLAQSILERYPSERRQRIIAAAPSAVRRQWIRNEGYAENAIGHMMEPALAVFSPTTTVAEATRELRQLVMRAFITYLFVVDAHERLCGVVAMREMLLSRPDQRLDEIMVKDPFYLTGEMELVEAMKATMVRHYPVYPVCDADKKLIGLVRGQMLFEAETVELSLQAGSMVGVEREERLNTPWAKSLWFRHPWLQANLFLGFLAAAVVGYFQGTIDRFVALAVFLPVVIGQSSNTGVQTLAVALRGMTLGELKAGGELGLVMKETLLGLLNGMFTGMSAALGMFIFASHQNSPVALKLSVVVFLSMVGSCLVSGIFGASIPLFLRRLGADPANASSIVLTTITDVTTLAVFLGLATWMI